MLFSPPKLLVPHLPISCLPTTLSPFLLGHLLHCTFPYLNTKQITSDVSLEKIDCISLSFVSSSVRLHSRILRGTLYTGESSHFTKLLNQKADADIQNKEVLVEELQVKKYSNWTSSIDNIDNEDDKEMQRRRKIGLANKGKVPWNKGRKHSAETREKISQKTKEAMSDPKVRKKIAECPRSRSEQTKERIRSSITKLWGKRLQRKRSREKFLQSWAKSIARAAKTGGSDQQGLCWNSYDKIKREIALQQLQQAVENEKAKNMSRIQTERRAQEKTEKKARLAGQKRKGGEEKAKTSTSPSRKATKNSKEEKTQPDIEVKLKERLKKLHKKRAMISQLNAQRQWLWEKIDLESVKRDGLKEEVSLADQIRGAKDKREEFVTLETFPTSPLLSKVGEYEKTYKRSHQHM